MFQNDTAKLRFQKIIQYCFGKWSRPIKFWFVSLMLFFFFELALNFKLANLAMFCFQVGFLANIISAIYLLSKKNRRDGLLSLSFILVAIITTVVVVTMANPFARKACKETLKAKLHFIAY